VSRCRHDKLVEDAAGQDELVVDKSALDKLTEDIVGQDELVMDKPVLDELVEDVPALYEPVEVPLEILEEQPKEELPQELAVPMVMAPMESSEMQPVKVPAMQPMGLLKEVPPEVEVPLETLDEEVPLEEVVPLDEEVPLDEKVPL
jgi:hypothetical protein